MDKIDKIRQEIKRRHDYENEMYHKKKLDGRPNDGWAESLAIMGVLEELLSFIDTLSEETKNHGCGVEFPHFGANYPDAKCIDGYLWDMDSYEDGVYTIGGDDPCPICNTEEWLKDVLDDEIFKTRDEALEYVKMLKSKYKHKDSLPEEKPSEDLEDVARLYADNQIPTDYPDYFCRQDIKNAFIAGAEWQKSQMVPNEDVFKIWGTTEKEYLAKSMDKVHLEMEISTYLKDWEDDEEIGLHLSTDNGCIPIELEDVRDLARHFAQWGAEHLKK